MDTGAARVTPLPGDPSQAQDPIVGGKGSGGPLAQATEPRGEEIDPVRRRRAGIADAERVTAFL